MRRQHLTLVALGALLVACSEDSITPLSSKDVGPGPGWSHDIGGQGGVGGDASAPETLGDLDIVDIADSDCATPEGDAVDLFEGEPYPLIAQRIVRIESTYVAYGADVEGLMWFDDAGVAFSEPAGSVVAVAVHGNRLWAAMADGALVLQRFKSSGAPTGAARVIADEAPAAVAIATSDDAVTLAWAESGRILARSLVDGKLLEPFVVADQAWTTFARVGIAAAADGMAIAWTGDVTPGSMRTSFALVGAQAVIQAPAELFTTSGHHELVELEPTSTGFAMLLTGGLPELHPYLLMLDDAGKPAGPAGRLLGAHFGWDLASRGHEVGVVSSRHSGEPQLRSFDTGAKPLGGWICLAPRGDIDLPVALAAEPEGFATLYFEPETPPDGRELFRRIAQENQP